MQGSIFLIQIMMYAVLSLHLPCYEGEYQIGQECCPKCPPGTRVKKHCTEISWGSCELCDEGTYMDNKTGSTECFPCRICASGAGLKVKTKCSLISNTVCEAQEGHFCEQQAEGSCVSAQKHRSCSEAEFIIRAGSRTEDVLCGRASRNRYAILASFIFIVSICSVIFVVVHKLRGQPDPQESPG